MMNNSKSAEQQALHCGKWTPEEEAYVQCLIEEFQAGYLPIREGTSLRSFLSKMLNCKPKRISKKFEGSDYNGKQVYVSQPYKLTAEEARERRDRLCTLEKKFHQSVAELKNAEGMKQQPYVDEPLDAAVVAAGLDTLPMGASLPSAVAGSSSAGFPSAASMQSGNAAMNSINPMANSMANMNSMSSMSSMNAAAMNNPSNDLTGGPNSQILDELAFQESMMRLRAQQQQQQQQEQQQQQLLQMDSSQQQQQQLQLQQQQQQQQQLDEVNLPSQQQQQGLGGPSGSYVDPILGSLALSQNAVNTTPLAASHQYWRRQALLEASSHLDSIRMAQAGAIGIQRPSLEPGGLRDLRVPQGNGGGGMGGMGGSGFGGGGCDFDGSSGGMDPTGASAGISSLKKRRVSGTMDGMNAAGLGGFGGLPGNGGCAGLGKGGATADGSSNSSNKRMRRSNDIPGDASKLGRFTF